jgi:hypothetical protein
MNIRSIRGSGDKTASEKEIDEAIAKRVKEMIENGFSIWATELFESGAKFVLKLIEEAKR